MSLMFGYASSFNQDISDWRVDKVTDMAEMFRNAVSFNRPLRDWSVDKVTSISGMFYKAKAFDQDLGWCFDDDVSLTSAFIRTKCKSRNCSVGQKDAIGICEWLPWARPCLIGTKKKCYITSGTLIIAIVLVLLAGFGTSVHREKKVDETYAAAARRVLYSCLCCCCLCCRKKEEKSSVNSQPDSPAESPRDEPDEEATAEMNKATESAELPNFSKRLTSFLLREQEEAPEEEEATAHSAAEAEEPTSTEQPPPPPAKRWFSREPPKAEEMHQRVGCWYTFAPEAAALRAAWGEYPGTPDALQAWPGFVQVTNAFLDAKLDAKLA